MTRTTLVILGASGDLARRLLFPALYRLEAACRLDDVDVVGYALDDLDPDAFRALIHDNLLKFAPDVKAETWATFGPRVGYVRGDLSSDALARLADQVPGQALFYLALPPGFFADAARGLAGAGFASEANGFRRLVIEKPFGTDLKTARALNASVVKDWREDQVFRIDHFLGKETVQNLMVFRFANSFLEPILNCHHVSQVQITAAETLGLEGRYRYYDGIGALRDMIQNHLMQLFTLIAIEPPALMDSEIVRDHKVEVLRAVRPLDAQSLATTAARGQYRAGIIRDAAVPGYREEPGVPNGSNTDTFAAVRLEVDNWRWKGVPFYLRSGKRLARDLTEIAVELKAPPTRLFRRTPLERSEANWLVFRIRPDEAIELWAQAKRPGLELEARRVVLKAPYRSVGEPDFAAYEQLLLDAIEGDHTPFLRYDEVDTAWHILQPLLDEWTQGAPEPYASGSEGPRGQELLLDDGHLWRSLLP